MATHKAIERSRAGFTVGYAGLGLWGGAPGTVPRQVHDGDTINVRAIGNFGIRFLGVDAPEISFPLPERISQGKPDKGGFPKLADPAWVSFLSDPFDPDFEPFNPPLEPGLIQHLQTQIGAQTAANQSYCADKAREALMGEVESDIQALGKTKNDFEFFLAFAYEVVDVYGRLLAFVNRNQPDENDPAPRPDSYNERLLQQGWVIPYFIWPNIDPFRTKGSLAAAVWNPGTAAAEADKLGKLRSSREWCRQARSDGLGVFNRSNSLVMEPFVVRFLAQRRPPSRWVIDLSKNDDVLIRPQNYYTIPNVEDRLFIPEDFVPFFIDKGWRKQP